jgi:predicted DsbA family dithiol-disulfide isomerase
MNIEIWSDVVCPWCYIGKRRLEAALAQFPQRDEVTLTWRSFELDPHAPDFYPGTNTERLARKYGVSIEEAAEMNARVTGLAAEAGLDYHLDQARPANTFDAHRLIYLGKARGVQAAIKERLMRAYFTEGELLSDHETLVRLGGEAGLDAEEARAVLASDAYADDVRADERRAAEFGIRGVPFAVLDERYGVSGAQPVAVFLDALLTAHAAARPLTVIGATSATSDDGDAAGQCEDESCAV